MKMIEDTESFLLGYQIGRRLKSIDTLTPLEPSYTDDPMQTERGEDMIAENSDYILPEG